VLFLSRGDILIFVVPTYKGGEVALYVSLAYKQELVDYDERPTTKIREVSAVNRRSEHIYSVLPEKPLRQPSQKRASRRCRNTCSSKPSSAAPTNQALGFASSLKPSCRAGKYTCRTLM
jgi:hypothetical protein